LIHQVQLVSVGLAPTGAVMSNHGGPAPPLKYFATAGKQSTAPAEVSCTPSRHHRRRCVMPEVDNTDDDDDEQKVEGRVCAVLTNPSKNLVTVCNPAPSWFLTGC
jgi:hypothetical protein